jgi:hypothetical protein
VRAYYASNVVGRILAAPGTATKVVHDYENVPGAIPIPATLSLELGKVISEQQHNIAHRFVSDYPFANRAPHALDAFEADALRQLRENPHQMLSDVSSSLFSDRVRLIGPVVMGQACVNCHNAHPEKPEARLEGRRRQGHPGGQYHSADRRQHLRLQVSAGLFHPCRHGRAAVHCHAAAAGSRHPGNERGAGPTIFLRRCR